MHLPLAQKVRTTDISLLIQATIFGLILGEISFISKVIANVFNEQIHLFNTSDIAVIIVSLLATMICVMYFFIREGRNEIKKILRCNRIDLLSFISLLGIGISISAVVGGIGTPKYQEYIGLVNPIQLIIIVALPIVMGAALILKSLLVSTDGNKPTPFFINDQAITRIEDDLLELNDSSHRFAERVLNGGAFDSLVFGIDAPWGMGKSSYINFCCEYWESREDLIIYKFEPLRYINDASLVESFVNELIKTIQRQAFVPTIQSLFAKYLRLIKGKSDFSFCGFNLQYKSNSDSVQETLHNLELRLTDLNRKIIIIVDDLDRLSWAEIKNILFAIKRSFMLPNVSYVLCYDTQNLALWNKDAVDDADKVKDFLEKFVNVKISLFIDTSKLTEFVSSNIETAINNNLQLDVHLLDQIKQGLGALEDIYKSDKYIFYQDLIGDIRKIKRLINTMMLFEIPATDFENSDFNKNDLINLLLLYINYSHIFRDIYNSETSDKNGFFSLEYSYRGSGQVNFKNSDSYNSYIENSQLTEKQKFLLGKLFDVRNLENMDWGDEEANKMSRACFNGQGSSGRNLERYLNLIVKLAKPNKHEAYHFYLKKKDELFKGITSVEEIFEDEVFDFSKGDFSRDELWRVIANSAHELKPDIGSAVIIYLINNLTDYSFLEYEKVGAGSRINLVYSLLKLLDKAGWGSDGGRPNNSEDNISEIAEWIFAEGRHSSTGVVKTLSNINRGPLGLFDLLLFRLYCSADRGSSLFDLQRAITKHRNPNAPTTGLTTEIAKEGMREISQLVFEIFVNQYIKQKKNIFKSIDNLTLNDFAGRSVSYIHTLLASGELTNEELEKIISSAKSHVKAFVVYQLGNSMISSGVGCGYYDETGTDDQHGIAARMNRYLFSVCFNPSVDAENYERFLDYLLLNLARDFGSSFGGEYIPHVSEFTKVLDLEKLRRYWLRHRRKILQLKFELKDKKIFTGNYVASYKDDLLRVYNTLDQVV